MTFLDPRIEEELRHHIDERVDRLVDPGMEPGEARRQAEAALGARPERVARLVLGHGFRLAAVGIVLGIGLSLGLSRFLQALLYGVDASHPVHFALPAIVLAVVALLAT